MKMSHNAVLWKWAHWRATPSALSSHEEREMSSENTRGGGLMSIAHPNTERCLGVEKERVDPAILALIHALFGERGIEFLSKALSLAVIKQLSLPDLSDSFTDVAVIQAPNLRALAKAMGWCYDTVDKYTLLFCALLFLRKSRSRRNGTELYFPLGKYHLPESAATNLTKLYRMRPKVASLARKVAGRLATLTPPATPPLIGRTPVPQKGVHSHLGFDLDGAIADVEMLLSPVLDSHQQQQIFPQIKVALCYRCRLGTEGSDFSPGALVEALIPSSPSEKGATSAQVISSGVQEKLPTRSEGGDFSPGSKVKALIPSSPSEKEATSAQVVSSGVQGKLPTLSLAGDFLPVSPSATFPETGDFSEERAENGQLSHQARERLPETGDFAFAPAASLNDNAIIPHNTINKGVSVNDVPSSDHYTPKEAGQVGRLLAHFLEKSPANIGGFVNKAKQCTRTVIRAAVVDTLVHQAFPTIDPLDPRGRPRNRGRWFHDATNRYSSAGTPIPAYVLRWVKTDLTFQEIEQELNAAATAYQSYMVTGNTTADLVRQYLHGEIEKSALDQALQQASGPAGATGSIRALRMVEWKGRMVSEEQAYKEGYYGGFERFKPSGHPVDDLAARVKYYQSIGKLPTFPPATENKGEQQ